ncbi:MAG: cytochrome-c oxidase, cbb3-type subunit II, partial [Ignavibacteria bacterium]|nr:cytochrome-c oxidase, cbb3-type subunit II [Ignavibacteria bacterium]
YSSIPDWAQSLGTVFSIMLIAPSWGGMLNGLLTLRGVWDKVREDPVLKFMVVAITAYGMATFEGPLLAIKSVNAISHFTDWTIAHVHIGALGWNGFLAFGVLYWLIPRLYRTTLYSKKMANAHFWLGFVGILTYAVPLYWAAIVQSLMWKQFTPEGLLQYTNFLETVTQIIPMYIIRSIGGLFYLTGVTIMIVNIFKTCKQGSFLAEEDASAPALVKSPIREKKFHRMLESMPYPFVILTIVAILVGSIVEIVPMLVIKSNIPTIASVKPYTPLELIGRDIYISEGCYVCHSQMIRPFRSETARYGEYSKAGEFVYDHPFQWGSKRTGPDLHRVGGKYPNSWHYYHMKDPASMSPGSIMPPYPWLLKDDADVMEVPTRVRAMITLGVPYPAGYADKAISDYKTQAQQIVDELKATGIAVEPNKKIVALIAYLQRLGIDIKGTPVIKQ